MVTRNEDEDPPIPSYEEATLGDTYTAADHGGDGSIHEREGLLGGSNGAAGAGTRSNYRRPTVRSVRSSMDTDIYLQSSELGSSRGASGDLRRELLELEVEDPLAGQRPSTASRVFTGLGKLSRRVFRPLSHLADYLPVRSTISWLGERVTSTSRATGLFAVRFIALLFVLAVIYFVFVSDISPVGRKSFHDKFDPEAVKTWVQEKISEDYIDAYLKHISGFDHLSGTEGDFSLARWVEKLFKEAGLEDVGIKEYNAYLNYPTESGREVSIQSSAARGWKALLEEQTGYPEGASSATQEMFSFHGLSKAGNVTGRLVYANLGRVEDFAYLQNVGVNVKDKIVLMKVPVDAQHVGSPVMNAQREGALGCLFYSDAAQDHSARLNLWQDNVVQRMSASSPQLVLGDVLSPGWASIKGAKRLNKAESKALPSIPSLPIAWRDARVLILSLEGHGSRVPNDWVGGISGVAHWMTGDEHSPLVNLRNEQDEDDSHTVRNVLGTIPGDEQPEKKIIVGNPRDAWCLGAGSPGSGTAVMLEVVRLLGDLMKLGWRPLRTIQFASWDGSAQNLIGSTEWTEENMEDLRANGMAYVNVAGAVTGPNFRAHATPSMARALIRTLGRTVDPSTNGTLKETFEHDPRLGRLTASGDYAPFQFMAGVSSIDLSFTGPDTPVGSCYDSYAWTHTVNDPQMQYHKVLAQVLALMILDLADAPLIPMSMMDYSSVVSRATSGLTKYALEKQSHEKGSHAFTLNNLEQADATFARNSELFDNWQYEWLSQVEAIGGFETTPISIRRQSHNSRLTNFEAHVLDLSEGGGLKDRQQYKHLLQGVDEKSPDLPTYFPSIVDAIDRGDWKLAQEEADKVADILSKAATKLLN